MEETPLLAVLFRWSRKGGKTGTIRDKYGNNPGAGGAGSSWTANPAGRSDLLCGKDYAFCTTFWTGDEGKTQYGGAGSGGSTSGAYTTFVQGLTTVSEGQSMSYSYLHDYPPKTALMALRRRGGGDN